MNWKIMGTAALALGLAACGTDSQGNASRTGSPAAQGLNRAGPSPSTGGTTTVQEPGTGVSSPESNPGPMRR